MKNAFLDTLGRSSIMKIFDYLLDQGVDVSVSDICDGTKLSRKTVDTVLIDLMEQNLVKLNRTIGNTKMFVLNDDNPVIKKLADINRIVLKQQELKLEKNIIND